MNNITGRCLCGKVTFVYNDDLGTASYCHCDDCRRCTGSAFNVSVRVEREKLIVKNENDLGIYTYITDSGNEMSRLFCINCGSPIMTLYPTKPEYAWIKAGIIDQIDAIKPVREAWTSRKVPWADINVANSFSENAI
jgi:hypothetical protein